MKWISMMLCFLSAFVVGFLIWGKFLHWCFSQVPSVQYAGLIKIGLTIIVGYFGGVGIPLFFIGLGFMCYGLFQ